MPTITKGPPKTARLRWRVVVGTQGLDPSRPSRPLSWHLADCASPTLAEAHCPRGRELIIENADPDGHCWTGENCPRCANLIALAAVLEVVAAPSEPEPVAVAAAPSAPIEPEPETVATA